MNWTQFGKLELQNCLKVNPEVPIEWWYFHGRYKDKGGVEKTFMLSLFRVAFEKSNTLADHGYMMIINVLDCHTKEFEGMTIISQALFDNLKDNEKLQKEFYKESSLHSVELENLRKNQLDQSATICLEPVIIDPEKGFLKWDKFSAVFSTNSLSVRFNLPKTEDQLTLNCQYEPTGWTTVNNDVSERLEGMNYICHPNIKIVGESKIEEIGNLWFDHQWGSTNWFFGDQSKDRLKGWRWFGINFDDGSQLILWQSFMVNSQEVLSNHFAFLPHGLQGLCDLDFHNSTDYFSHRYYCYYPLEQVIKINAIGCQGGLKFIPDIGPQEQPIFGPMRSLWQGSGQIQGEINGKKVKGTARRELAGFSYISQMTDVLKPLSVRVVEVIKAFLPETLSPRHLNTFVGAPFNRHNTIITEKLICEPTWSLINRGGKRWRSILAYFMLQAFGVDPEPYEDVLFITSELMHTGSLIIDDIQDSSIIRRGKKSIHKEFGTGIAINAANTLYYLPTSIIPSHPNLNPNQKFELLKILNDCALKAHFGQTEDLYRSEFLNSKNLVDLYLKPDEILQTYSLKTGAILMGLSQSVCIVAQTDERVKREAIAFGEALGISYQIIDDLNNFSDSAEWGKEPGEDLTEGKITYLLSHFLANEDNETGQKVLNCLKKNKQQGFDSEFEEVIEIIRNSKSINDCKTLARETTEKAWSKFAKNLKDSESKSILEMLVLKVSSTQLI